MIFPFVIKIARAGGFARNVGVAGYAKSTLKTSKPSGPQGLKSAKKGPSRKPAKGKANFEGRDGNSELIMQLLQPKQDLQQPSPDELEKWKILSKEYSRRKLNEHRQWQMEMATKIRLKQAALLALPEELRAHAAKRNEELPPLSRRIPTLTPPIQDYKAVKKSKASANERRIGDKN